MHDLIVVAVAATLIFVLAAAAQAITGFGLALVAVPLLAIVVAPVPSVVGTTAIAFILTGFVARAERSHIEGALVRKFTFAGILGMPVGLVALKLLGADELTFLMAAVLLILVALLAFKVRLPSGGATQWSAGVTSGALLASTGMNGPPIVVLLHAMHMPSRRFRGTLQGIFCLQDFFAMLGFLVIGALDTTVAAIVVGGILGVPLGWRVGNRLFHALPQETFRRVVLGGLALTALAAAFNAAY